MTKKLTTLSLCLLLVATFASPVHADVPCPYQTDLIAGQHTDAGDVLVWKEGCTLFVKYTTSDCWKITETHLHVAATWEEIPQTKKGNPIPGKFDYQGTHPSVTEYTYEIDLGDLCQSEVCIAAHAVVKCDGRTETAWGDGTDFPGKNWAMYFCLTPEECEPPSCDDPVLLNGSFETPEVDTTQGWDIVPDGAPTLGWTIEWRDSSENGRPAPQLEFMREDVGEISGWMAEENSGSQWVELDSDWDGPDGDLHGEAASVVISQSINTCPDRTYKLTFYYSPRPGHDDNGLKVTWGLNEVFSISDVVGGAGTVWTKVELTGLVPSGGATTMLRFAETGKSDAEGMFLDNVSIVLE